jgi:hypothetical protein
MRGEYELPLTTTFYHRTLTMSSYNIEISENRMMQRAQMALKGGFGGYCSKNGGYCSKFGEKHGTI